MRRRLKHPKGASVVGSPLPALAVTAEDFSRLIRFPHKFRHARTTATSRRPTILH